MAKPTPSIFQNIGYLSIAQLLSAVFGFVTLTVLSRALGPSNFGILGFGAAILSLLGIITTLGSDQFGAREISREHHMAGVITIRLLVIRLGLATVAYSILFLFDIFIVRGPLESRILLIQGLGVFVTAFTIDYLFQGLSRMNWIAWRQITAAGLIMLASILLVQNPEDLAIAAWIYLIAGAAVILVILCKGMQIVLTYKIRDLNLNWRRIFNPMLTMAITGAMQAVILNTDLIMLGLIRSNDEVGLYTAVVRIGMLTLIPAGLVIAALFPELAKNSETAGDRSQVGRRYTTILLFLGIPFPCMVMILPTPFLLIVFGESFSSSAHILTIMMITTLLAHLRLMLDTPLVAWQLEAQVMKITLIGALANVLLNGALIPSFGMLGAVSASLFSQIIMAVGCSFIYLFRGNSLPLFDAARVGFCAISALTITIICIRYFNLEDFIAPLQLLIAISIFATSYLVSGYFIVWQELRALIRLTKPDQPQKKWDSSK